MSIGSFSNLSSNYLQSLISASVQQTASTTNATNSASSSIGIDASSVSQTDGEQLSPFARLVSTLQELQQSDPAKYKDVTGKIAANLKSAASAAQADGNTTAANQLNQLADDFTKASTSGDLPDLKDLSKAVRGHHGHHRPHPHSDTATDSATASDSSASNSTMLPALSQILAAFQAEATQNNNQAFNPDAIILKTLSDAGVSGVSAQ